MVIKSDTKLKMLLGSTKDRTPDKNKAGIYKVTCEDGCDLVYYGKTI